jgi:biotin carboxyl carrier protein
MSDSYKLNINDSFQFDFDKEQVSQLDAVKLDSNSFHILHDSRPFKAEILSADFIQKSYVVRVNNNSYTVAIANDLDLLIKELGFEVGLAKQVNAIKAPMPGLILEISVIVGQVVKENDSLLILEAMKMAPSSLFRYCWVMR